MTMPNDFLYIVDLNNARDVDVERGISEPSWEDFRDSLMTHQVRRFKDGPAFIPVMMKPEHEWVLQKAKKADIWHYRFDVNIEAITSLVIDIDKPGALEASEQIFEGYEYVVYSTHNFTPETPWKYRMIVRLAEPIAVEDWPTCFDALKSRIELDPSCRNPSRCYYYPSHSVDAHISPRAFYRSGRAISAEEIIALGTAEVRSSLSPLKMRTIGTLPVKNVRARRHFSGKVVAHYDKLPTVMSFDRKDYEQRHARSIADYAKDDSRHNLALSITSREYYMLGPRVDVRSMLLFLYQVAAQGSKPLEAGNTVEELPDMLLSAMQKYAPEATEKLINDYGDRAVTWLIDEVDWAQKNYQHMHQRNLTRPQESPAETSYQAYRAAHRVALKEYVKNGDARALFIKFTLAELKADQPNYQDLAGALIRFCKGYLSNIANKPEAAVLNELSGQVRDFTDLIKSGDGILSEIDVEKRVFMRSALLVELTKEKKKTQSNDFPPSP